MLILVVDSLQDVSKDRSSAYVFRAHNFLGVDLDALFTWCNVVTNKKADEFRTKNKRLMRSTCTYKLEEKGTTRLESATEGD